MEQWRMREALGRCCKSALRPWKTQLIGAIGTRCSTARAGTAARWQNREAPTWIRLDRAACRARTRVRTIARNYDDR